MHLRLASSAAVSLLLACVGCNQVVISPSGASTTSPVSVAGNWQVSSSDPVAAMLPSLSGALAGGGSSITGIVHSDSSAACIAPSVGIALTGSADAANHVTLTGVNLAGGMLTLSGTLATDGRSMANVTYKVSGGTCAFAAAANATAQSFSSITGNYTGTFSDPDGQVLTITAMLTQTPASDTSGNFQLSGTGTLGTNPCFSSPATISNSQVTGGSFTLTYNDPSLANSVTASGTFSTDGSTLTVTNWSLTGACGADTGNGLLTRH